MFKIVTVHGFVLFRGVETADGGVILTYRADQGICNLKYSTIDQVMRIAPTAHKIVRSDTPKNPYPMTHESPSVCEILNRGD